MTRMSRADLEATVRQLVNSKLAFLARLTSSPESFGVIDEVSEVARDGALTHFTLGDNIARVTIDAIGDSVTLTPLLRAEQYRPVTIDLKNETPEVDFDEVTAAQLYDVYKQFRDGPDPSGTELAAGLNRHVA